mmetsp:Transcript_31765/g.109244  ORF Transcript_31765/g.109244 Transcript_31765/m.109244 type:complete len:493 (-) Transcript_31765:56-1534(-)
MRYCTVSVFFEMAQFSSRAMGEWPKFSLKKRSSEGTVGGSCFVSPTKTTCSARAATSATIKAGSVVCAASSKTTIGNLRPSAASSPRLADPTQLATTTGADETMTARISSTTLKMRTLASARTSGVKDAFDALALKDKTSGCLSAMAAEVLRRAAGETDAGLPARMAGTPISIKASNKTSAAPLECATAKTLVASPLAPRSRKAAAMRTAATRVLPVPGGPRTSAARLPRAQEMDSTCDGLASNFTGASASAPETAARTAESKGCVCRAGVRREPDCHTASNTPFSKRAGSNDAAASSADASSDDGDAARKAPSVRMDAARRSAASPAVPLPRARKAERCASSGPRFGVMRSNLTRKLPGVLRASQSPLGHVFPTPTVSQSAPASMMTHSRGAKSAARTCGPRVLSGFKDLPSSSRVKVAVSPRCQRSLIATSATVRRMRTTFSPHNSVSGVAAAENSENPRSSKRRGGHVARRFRSDSAASSCSCTRSLSQ